MYDTLTIVAKAGEEHTARKLLKAGANRVVTPSQIAGRRIAVTLLRPSVANFLDVVVAGGDVTLRVEEFHIGPDGPPAEPPPADSAPQSAPVAEDRR